MRPINLLPRESKEKARARQRMIQLIVLAVAYIVLLAFITVVWQGRVTDAENEIEEARAINQGLQAEIAGLQDARDLVARYDENVAVVSAALDADISWGRVLNDLGRMIPDRVWLTTLTGAAQATEEGTLGSLSMQGTAFDFPDVSAWLRSLDSDRFPSVSGTWVTGMNVGLIGEIEVVGFTTATSLTPDSSSDRLRDRIPEVPR